MEAQFKSRCSACEAPIYEGDEIKNDGGSWVHEHCASVDMTERRPIKWTVSDLDWSD